MKQEIMVATKWISENCLLSKDGISSEILERFEMMIQKLLEEKYRGHWYETEPYRGQAFRAVGADEYAVDKIIALAAEKSGLPEVDRIMRKKWMLWVDPGEVEVKDEVTNQRIVLYSARRDASKPVMYNNISTNTNRNNTSNGRTSPTKMNVNSKQFVPSNFGFMQNSILNNSAVNYGNNNNHQNSQKTILRRPNSISRTNGYHLDGTSDDVEYDYRIPSPRDHSVTSQA